MKHLFALLLAASTVALSGCSDKSDGDAPTPAAEFSLHRELRFPLTPSTPNGDTVSVVHNTYDAKGIKATALGPDIAASSYMGLQIRLDVAEQTQNLSIMIPSTKLSPAWTGQYPCETLYQTAPTTAGGIFFVGTRELIDTYHNFLCNGLVTITKYDTQAKLVSGTFSLRQTSVSDPFALAGLPEPLRKKCTVVVTGSFANLPVQP